MNIYALITTILIALKLIGYIGWAWPYLFIPIALKCLVYILKASWYRLTNEPVKKEFARIDGIYKYDL